MEQSLEEVFDKIDEFEDIEEPISIITRAVSEAELLGSPRNDSKETKEKVDEITHALTTLILTKYKHKVESLKQVIEVNNHSKDKLQSDYIGVKEEMQAKQDIIQSLNDQIYRLKEYLENADLTTKSLNEQIETLNKEKAALEEKVQKVTQQNSDLTDRAKQLEEIKNHKEETQHKVRENISKALEENKRLYEKISELNQTIEGMKKEEKKRNSLNTRYDELCVRYTELLKVREDRDRIQKECDELRERYEMALSVGSDSPTRYDSKKLFSNIKNEMNRLAEMKQNKINQMVAANKLNSLNRITAGQFSEDEEEKEDEDSESVVINESREQAYEINTGSDNSNGYSPLRRLSSYNSMHHRISSDLTSVRKSKFKTDSVYRRLDYGNSGQQEEEEDQNNVENKNYLVKHGSLIPPGEEINEEDGSIKPSLLSEILNSSQDDQQRGGGGDTQSDQNDHLVRKYSMDFFGGFGDGRDFEIEEERANMRSRQNSNTEKFVKQISILSIKDQNGLTKTSSESPKRKSVLSTNLHSAMPSHTAQDNKPKMVDKQCQAYDFEKLEKEYLEEAKSGPSSLSSTNSDQNKENYKMMEKIEQSIKEAYKERGDFSEFDSTDYESVSKYIDYMGPILKSNSKLGGVFWIKTTVISLFSLLSRVVLGAKKEGR